MGYKQSAVSGIGERMKKGSMFLGIMMMIILVFIGNLFAQGNCLDFDGLDDYVDLGSPTDLDNLGQGSYTIEAWIKTSDANTRQCIIGNYDGTPAYVLELHTTGNMRFYVNNTGYNTTAEVDDGQWHHVVGVRDYNNDILLYVDGIEIYSFGSDPEGSFTVSNNTMIGRNPSASYALNFDGFIDDVRIWNDVRTESEIQNNMYNELTGTEDNLAAYYNLNEGSGQTAGDSAGSNDGILGITSGSDPEDPSWFVSDAPLPVTLSSFTATFSNGSSFLNWTTQSETNNLGWNVYRSETEGIAEGMQINSEMIDGAGTTTEQTDYTFTDNYETYPNNSYWYWIESVDYSGATNLHGPARIDIPDDEDDELPPELITSYGLAQNFPNPFNPTTRIAFKITVGDAKNAKIIIYNSKGQIVKVFTNLHTNDDELGSVTWKGKDENGNTVSSGIYLYKLETNNEVYKKKMIIVK